MLADCTSISRTDPASVFPGFAGLRVDEKYMQLGRIGSYRKQVESEGWLFRLYLIMYLSFLDAQNNPKLLFCVELWNIITKSMKNNPLARWRL